MNRLSGRLHVSPHLRVWREAPRRARSACCSGTFGGTPWPGCATAGRGGAFRRSQTDPVRGRNRSAGVGSTVSAGGRRRTRRGSWSRRCLSAEGTGDRRARPSHPCRSRSCARKRTSGPGRRARLCRAAWGRSASPLISRPLSGLERRSLLADADGKAAPALDHRGDVGRPVLLAEDRQVGLPVADLRQGLTASGRRPMREVPGQARLPGLRACGPGAPVGAAAGSARVPGFGPRPRGRTGGSFLGQSDVVARDPRGRSRP
jgi:hypothetical protein